MAEWWNGGVAEWRIGGMGDGGMTEWQMAERRNGGKATYRIYLVYLRYSQRRRRRHRHRHLLIFYSIELTQELHLPVAFQLCGHQHSQPPCSVEAYAAEDMACT